MIASIAAVNDRHQNRSGPVESFLLSGALPDDAREALERDEPLARIGPVLQLFNATVIEQLAAGAAVKKSAGGY